MNLPTRRIAPAAAQSGAASLIVVMVLFFIVAMTAAYTNRNLIFEQRTSLNQLRATTAFEAADAGAEWAIAQLNAGAMNTSCIADPAAGPNTSFRQRYLTINSLTGALVPTAPANAGSVNPVCVFDGNPANWGWQCRCPLADEAAGAVTGRPPQPADKPAPAFMIRLATAAGGRTDVFSLYSYGCTQVADAADPNSCLDQPTKVVSGDAVARVQIAVTLRYALTRLPSAALTVDGTLTAPGFAGVLTAINTDVASNGVTVHVGCQPVPATNPPQCQMPLPGLPGQLVSQTFAGTNPWATRFFDPVLQPDKIIVPGPPVEPDFTVEHRRFAAFFGMRPSTYQRQPGLPMLNCVGGCTAAAVNALIAQNPGRPIWIQASSPAQPADKLTINAPIGTAADPALLIVEGDVDFTPGVAFTGMIYGLKSTPTPVGTPWVWPGTWTWTGAAGASILGAAVSQGDLLINGAGPMTITYDANVLKRLRLGYGTFVKVPGSWRDFDCTNPAIC